MALTSTPEQYGIREVCDLGFYEIAEGGGKGDLVFVIDTAKTSTLEGASTTVYAQGGKGNPRLVAWEGEKTLTFTVEDALISKEGLELLTGNDITENDNVIEISANKFAGYYYVEAKSLMRKESNGKDYLLTIVLPKVKVQSNFSIAMAPTGDPSTFNFVMDAFPGYCEAGASKKLLCKMVIGDTEVDADDAKINYNSLDIDSIAVTEASGKITLTGKKDSSNVSGDLKAAVKVVKGTAKVAKTATANEFSVTNGQANDILLIEACGVTEYYILTQ